MRDITFILQQIQTAINNQAMRYSQSTLCVDVASHFVNIQQFTASCYAKCMNGCEPFT